MSCTTIGCGCVLYHHWVCPLPPLGVSSTTIGCGLYHHWVCPVPPIPPLGVPDFDFTVALVSSLNDKANGQTGDGIFSFTDPSLIRFP